MTLGVVCREILQIFRNTKRLHRVPDTECHVQSATYRVLHNINLKVAESATDYLTFKDWQMIL